MVEIKGWRNGLLLILPARGEWDALLSGIEARLDEGKGRSFWRGAQATLDFGPRVVAFDEMGKLIDRLKRDFGLIPVAAVALDMSTKAVAERHVLKTYDELPSIQKASARDSEAEAMAAAIPAPGSNALYISHTMRSGQRLVHDGHLVILGDVNAGAEVVASGDVVVVGALRGLAHAGSGGDESARIVALTLRPPQLRIAGKIARAPEESGRGAAPRALEVARIENGEIQVFPL